jgi:hypothetical protein
MRYSRAARVARRRRGPAARTAAAGHLRHAPLRPAHGGQAPARAAGASKGWYRPAPPLPDICATLLCAPHTAAKRLRELQVRRKAGIG